MIYSLHDKIPEIHQTVFIAPGADIVGEIKIGEYSSVWFNCTIRGDGQPVSIGNYSNVQDHSIIHITTKKFSTVIGNHCTIGHRVTVHGAILNDFSFIGMSSTILDGCVIEPYGFVAAGALLTPGFVVPEKTLVAGIPAKIIRSLKPAEIELIEETALSYAQKAKFFRENLKPVIQT